MSNVRKTLYLQLNKVEVESLFYVIDTILTNKECNRFLNKKMV